MHAPLPEAYKRPPYRRSWTEAWLRLGVTGILIAALGASIHFTLVASDMVPNEDPDYWRLRILWWSVVVMVIVGLRGLAWVFDALVPSRAPYGRTASYRTVHDI